MSTAMSMSMFAATLALLAPSSGAQAQSSPLASVAQLSQKYVINDANPEAIIPSEKEKNADPLEFGYLLQDLLARVEVAQKAHDNDAVVRYYRAIAKAVPDQATGWSKLCEAYEKVNDFPRAIHACRYAIDRPGVQLKDYTRFVNLNVAGPDDLSLADAEDLKNVVRHLLEDSTITLAANHLACKVGVKTKDIAMLEACTAVLQKLAPDDSKTVVFKWSLAVQKGQREEAERLLGRAKAMGVVQENIERMQALTAGHGGPPLWATILGAALVLGALAYALWTVRRRRAFAHH
jgi:tetratricopeptide (TPR) repeat protein